MNKFKKHKILFGFLFFVITYFCSAIAFNKYRMNPDNEYYGNYLPGGIKTARTYEEIRKRMEATSRKPTLLEYFFWPAERIFMWTSVD